MLIYDIPGRTGAAVATQTLVRLAEQPGGSSGVKDAKDEPGCQPRTCWPRTDLVLLLRQRTC